MPSLTPCYYAYWSGLPTDGFETYIRARDGPRLGGATHSRRPHLRGPGLAAVAVRGQPQGRGGHVHEVVRARARSSPSGFTAPSGRRASSGTGDLPGFFHKPYGPGWALVGDAGYHKHPITAFGITDAFRDAEAAGVGPRRRLRRAPSVRGRDGRLPARSGRGGDADLRVHVRLREDRAAAARDAAAHRGDAGANRRRWTTS